MKKLFFLALLAFLYLPATTWADEHEDHESGQVEGSDDEVYDGEVEDNYGSIVPSDIQLTYKILSQPTGTYGEEGYVDGTVELEGIYSVPTGVTQYSISIPHEIQVVNIDMSDYTATVALYSVVGIGEDAFRVGDTYNQYNSSVTSVSIPYTVEYVGANSFYNNSNISSVVFAADATGSTSVTTIGEHAFHSCKFTSIIIPASVETIETYAISWNSSLATLTIANTEENPSQLTTLASYAFYGDTGLTSIELPEGLTTVGEYALGSTGLVSVVLPMSLVDLPQWLFGYCSSLTDVTMNGAVTLANGVFGYCTSLKALILLGDPGETGGQEGRNDYNSDSGITVYVPLGMAETYLDSKWANDVTSESALSWNFITEPVTVSENAGDGSNYYATYYVDYDDEDGYFLYGATPYVVTGTEDATSYSATITLSDITEGYNIPAGTAILVEASAAGDYYLYKEYGETPETATITSNLLMGTAEETTTYAPNSGSDDDYYFFQLSRKAEDGVAVENSVGFYWGEDDGAAFTCAAYRAWLPIEKSVFGSDDDDATPAKVLYIKKQGDTTGITSVAPATKAATDAIYNLQGVRVSDMSQKGIYIVNGKKVIKN